AYDLLSDKDKRARFDRGEIDADGNPAMPFGGGGFGGGGFRSGAGGPGAGGFSASDFEGFAGDNVDLGDIFEGLFGRGGRTGSTGFGGRRQAPPARGANINYRLKVPFTDAATL